MCVCVCVSRGRYLVALGRSWHPEEFTCSQCKAVLDEGGFFEERGSVYCTKCHDNRYAPNCAKCKKKITGVRTALLLKTQTSFKVCDFSVQKNILYWCGTTFSPFIRKSCMPWRWPTMFSVSSVQPARLPSGTKPFTWRRANPTVRKVRNRTVAVIVWMLIDVFFSDVHYYDFFRHTSLCLFNAIFRHTILWNFHHFLRHSILWLFFGIPCCDFLIGFFLHTMLLVFLT